MLRTPRHSADDVRWGADRRLGIRPPSALYACPVTTLQILDPDRRAIPYLDQGEGFPVVLVPAQGLNIASLGMLASVLVEEGFRVVRVGNRRTSSPAALTMHDLAQDVVEVMDTIGLPEDAWVGGHGFGGAVARTVAHDHPGRVSGVLLLGVAGVEPVSADAAQALQTVFSDAAEADALDAMRVLAGDADDLELAWTLFSGTRDRSVMTLQEGALAATLEQEWAPLPEKIPVLVIQGADDRVMPPENGDRLQAQAPERVSTTLIEGHGHLFVMTDPVETAGAIEDYLGWD